METKSGNTWAHFCRSCNHVRKGDKDKCHVCSDPLVTICLGCGTSPDQGEHTCKVITIPVHPLAVQNSQLCAEVEELKQQRQDQGLLNVKLMREAKVTELQINTLRNKMGQVRSLLCAPGPGIETPTKNIDAAWKIAVASSGAVGTSEKHDSNEKRQVKDCSHLAPYSQGGAQCVLPWRHEGLHSWE